jgi:hypothetical protein
VAAEDLDGVSRAVPENGRVDRGRIRQARLGGGLPDRGHVVLEPRGRGELQDVQRLSPVSLP